MQTLSKVLWTKVSVFNIILKHQHFVNQCSIWQDLNSQHATHKSAYSNNTCFKVIKVSGMFS